MQWFEFLIGMLALYGAVIATYLAAAPRVKLQRSLSVRSTLGYVNQSSVTNRGQKPITLTSAGLRLPRRGSVMFLKIDGEATLPHLLAAGKSLRLWIPAYRVARALKESGASGRVRVTGFVTDDLDHTYRSGAMPFERDAFEQALAEATAVPSSMAIYATPAPVASEPASAFKW
jgi:hypothetical protein